MEAVILAGGMGTRLREIISDVPKPMAPVNGKPFLYYVLKWLSSFKVEKLVLSTGYKSESIIGYFGKSFLNIPVEYAVEDKPLGTGGGLLAAAGHTAGDNILAVNGDTYFPIDLSRLCSAHTKKNSLFTVALKKMKDFSRYGAVDINGDNIIMFNEKKFCREGLINGGIYMLNRKVLSMEKFPGAFSLEKDLLEKMAGSSGLKSMVFDDPFLDIGIPEDYEKAASFLKEN
ncbi:MAG: nucleotidyltransferase family protein [Bacteroidales bacterium]|jgi:D-glycero-alpha-D-manno-heptose 1-phosphate guanylyltransferase